MVVYIKACMNILYVRQLEQNLSSFYQESTVQAEKSVVQIWTNLSNEFRWFRRSNLNDLIGSWYSLNHAAVDKWRMFLFAAD